MKSFFNNLKNSCNNFVEESRGKNNYKNPHDTPLHSAVMNNNLVGVLNVLNKSTLQDIQARNANGDTPFDIAVVSGRNDVARLIIHYKALLEDGINLNYTPLLHAAVMSGDIQTVKAVLAVSSLEDIMARSEDNEQSTAFDIAVGQQRVDIMREIRDASYSCLVARIDTLCQRAQEELGDISAKLGSLDFPSTFKTTAFFHYNEDQSRSLSGESDDLANC